MELMNTISMLITALATLAGACAVIWGIIIANRKVSESLETQKMIARSKSAVELIVLASKIKDAMDVIRSSWDSIPPDKIKDKYYLYEQRYERIAEYNDLFETLRDIQIQVKTIIGDVEVEKAVENLFSARHRIRVAIESLVMYTKLNDDEKYRVEIRDLREILYGDTNKTDATSQEINNALKTIETKLSPIARIEENKSKKI